ncbi:hypothetical protein BH10PSE7_BH10PSE7_15130 [soil metagenome]
MRESQRYLQVKTHVTVAEHARIMAEARRRNVSAGELVRSYIAGLPDPAQPAFDSRALTFASEGY